VAGAERDVGADVAEFVGLGFGLAELTRDVARRGGDELHQPVRVRRRDGLGPEAALLADDGAHEQRIEAVRPGFLLDDVPVAERIQVPALRGVFGGPLAARQAERGAGRADRDVGLEQGVARSFGGQGIELTAREAGVAERGQTSGPLGVRAGQVVGEGRDGGAVDAGHRRLRLESEPRPHERAVVGFTVALGDVQHAIPAPRVAQAIERARFPILGRDPLAAAARRRQRPELGRGPGVVAREPMRPAAAPAGVEREVGLGEAGRELAVALVCAAVVARFLADAAEREERLRGFLAGGETLQKLLVETLGALVLIGVPAPAGGAGERAGTERAGAPLGQDEAQTLGLVVLADAVGGARLEPGGVLLVCRIELPRFAQRAHVGERSGRIALGELALGLRQTLGNAAPERRTARPNAIGEAPRAACDHGRRGRFAYAVGECQCGARVALRAQHPSELEGSDQPGARIGQRERACPLEPGAGTGEVARSTSNASDVEACARRPGRLGMIREQRLRGGGGGVDAPLPCVPPNLEIERHVAERGLAVDRLHELLEGRGLGPRRVRRRRRLLRCDRRRSGWRLGRKRAREMRPATRTQRDQQNQPPDGKTLRHGDDSATMRPPGRQRREAQVTTGPRFP